MLETIEMRWFFRSAPLDESRHFKTTTTVPPRTDWYAIPCQSGCGIKLREGRLEVKLRLSRHGPREHGAFRGELESWTKWGLEFAPGESMMEHLPRHSGWIAVQKLRSLQHFEVVRGRVRQVEERPMNGCEFELTQLQVDMDHWWTVGFEAIGAADQLETNLTRVAETILERGGLEMPFVRACSFGYPHWLQQFVTRRGSVRSRPFEPR